MKMLYAVFSEDVENSLPKRAAVRDLHIERLVDLKNQGRLILAGPHPAVDCENPGAAGWTGSLVIAEFDSLAEAENWAQDDPYLKSGAYKNVRVKPFKKVLP